MFENECRESWWSRTRPIDFGIVWSYKATELRIGDFATSNGMASSTRRISFEIDMASTEALEELAEHIRRGLAEGFQAPEAVAKQAVEIVSEEHTDSDLTSAARAVLAKLLVERQDEQRSWPAVTDCDRLDAAFEQLNALGIMARHHWACCSNCAAAEMPDEFDRIGGAWQGVPIVGYTCYHHQNTASAVEGDGLYLGFGSTERAPSEQVYQEQCLKIAQTVCDVLVSHGLKVTWNGTYQQRPHVSLHWQRKSRPARFCGDDGFAGSCC